MNTDRQLLADCLTRNASWSLDVAGVMAMLDPLFQTVETEKHPVDTSTETDLVEALRIATGRQVTRLVTLPVRPPYGPHVSNLNRILDDTYWPKLDAATGFDLRRDVYQSYWNALGKNLSTVLRRQLEGAVDFGRIDDLIGSVHCAVYYYLLFTVTGDLEKMAELYPLVAHCGRTVVYGTDEVGTWYVTS
jgi:hypothetical protein